MSKPLHVGRLWLVWCALRHPNRWMIVWRRGLPEWDSRTKWKGSDKPGPYWKGCLDIGVLPNWIIVGGESGNSPRIMDPQWARDARDQCRELGIPFFMKQMTGKTPIPADLFVREFPIPRR